MAVLVLIAGTVLTALWLVSLVVALRAMDLARGRGRLTLESRIERLERELAALRPPSGAPESTEEASPAGREAPAPEPTRRTEPELEPPPARPPRDFEQVIGARWTTWIGIVAIVFALGFLLRWTFQNDFIGPAGRVGLGIASGIGLLVAGVSLRRRKDVAYLSEGLAGGGLACLYLSLYAAHQVYGFLGPTAAFSLMALVTAAGALVSVVTDRQPTAVLSVFGGLLTPILVTTEHPDERVLLSYLVVLDLSALAVARFKAWPGLNRLAWAGSALLCVPVLNARGAPAHPETRLLLLTALFSVFAAVPLLRSWLDRDTASPVDLALVFGNGGAYFVAVFLTLEPWRPAWEAPWAVSLAAVYVALALVHARRVAGDAATVQVHLGAALVAFSTAIPLAFDGPFVTLAWAVQAAVLLALARSSTRRGLAVGGGTVLFALAVARALVTDPSLDPQRPPVQNAVFLVGLAVVAMLGWGGWSARRLPEVASAFGDRRLASILWFAAALLLSVELWREPTGLWPGGLLIVELTAVAFLARTLRDPSFVYAALSLFALVVARLFLHDVDLARRAAERIVNAPLALRIVACGAAGLAGRWVRASDAAEQAPQVGAFLSGASGVLLLGALSLGWTMHQKAGAPDARLRLHVGLSILWAVYAACWLSVGFVRRIAAIRYAALALLGVTIAKVFLVDMGNLIAIYRILSFLVLGLVLLGVSYVYQKRKGGMPTT